MNRRRSGPMPRLGRAAVALQIAAALAFVAALLGAEGVTLPFTGGGELTLRAAFADAGGISGGERTPVLVAGVPMGEVTGVQLRAGLALVTMRLDAAARGVIRADAGAAIEPRSALDDMTIDITPGSPSAPAARDGIEIPAARTRPATSLSQVVSALDADTRAQLSVLVTQLGAGLRGGGGRLGRAVVELRSLLDPAGAVLAGLARRRLLISELVGSLARIGSAAASRDAALGAAIAAAARTLSVTAGEQSAVRASVASLPGTVGAADLALARVRALAVPLAPVLTRLRATATALPAALAAVRGFVPQSEALLAALGSFARGASAGGLHAAAGALSQLRATAGALTPVLSRLAPVLSAVDARRAGIGLLGSRFSGVLSTDDANGPVLRGLGTFEPFDPADFGAPGGRAGNSPAQRLALAAQAVRALTLTCLHGQPVACLVRYLIPGLPGAVR